MGFETQEAAERWAENMEFRADQRREELMMRALDKILLPAKGSAAEWLMSVTPILEQQRREEEGE